MRHQEVLTGWKRILMGRSPVLSIELTKECPLSCPGCYAFQPEHLDGVPLKSLSDFQGDELVESVLDLVDREQPLLVYIVGGEPLVRFRELNELLPRICARTMETHLVTSAVRPIPLEWKKLDNLRVVVSIDGLQPEHDARRAPATYDRILKHIEGHSITIHSTVTSQIMERDGYLEEFMDFWAPRQEIDSIQVSFFTPQIGETSVEILSPAMRQQAVDELARLHAKYPKIRVNEPILNAFLEPPQIARRLRLRPGHQDGLGGPRDRRHPLSAGRQPRLLAVRLPRLDGSTRGGESSPAARPQDHADLQRVRRDRTSRSQAARRETRPAAQRASRREPARRDLIGDDPPRRTGTTRRR